MKKFIILLFVLPVLSFAKEGGFDGPYFVSDTTSINKSTNTFWFYTADNVLYYSRVDGSYLTPVGSGSSLSTLTVDSLTVNKYLVVFRQDTIKVSEIDTIGRVSLVPRWGGFFNIPLGTGVLEDTSFYSGGSFYSQYQWRSSESTLQTDTLGINIPMPFYFPGFNTSSDSALKITINTMSTSSSNNVVDVIFYKKSSPATKVIETGLISSVAKTPRTYDYSAARSVISGIGANDVLVIKFALKSKSSYRAGICKVELNW